MYPWDTSGFGSCSSVHMEPWNPWKCLTSKVQFSRPSEPSNYVPPLKALELSRIFLIVLVFTKTLVRIDRFGFHVSKICCSFAQIKQKHKNEASTLLCGFITATCVPLSVHMDSRVQRLFSVSCIKLGGPSFWAKSAFPRNLHHLYLPHFKRGASCGMHKGQQRNKYAALRWGLFKSCLQPKHPPFQVLGPDFRAPPVFTMHAISVWST